MHRSVKKMVNRSRSIQSLPVSLQLCLMIALWQSDRRRSCRDVQVGLHCCTATETISATRVCLQVL
jgi:hypothetical protein